ncbi:hypothetical protein S1OALGB6SA_22 [Olavius algarvensis spirochete endosymbiont]|nr:hypothetical protein S1OALGB6SA_22 [Olavius algarvensis spirochete endosymbiont]
MKNLRREYLLWECVIFPLGGLSIFFLIFGLDLGKNSFGPCPVVVSFISWWLFCYSKLMSIKCPKCNKMLLRLILSEMYSLKNFAEAFKYPIPPKKCRNCNYDYRTHSSEKLAHEKADKE